MSADATGPGATGPLPAGVRVRLADDVRRDEDGRTLVGGAPMTVLRLGERAPAVVDDEFEVRSAADGLVARRLVERNLAHPVTASLPAVDPADLTVVVPVRDRAAELDRTLARVQGLRTVVVDDGSRDPAAVADVVSGYGAELVVLPENRGPAAARNAGLARVRTPWVAFVDSDVRTCVDDLLRLAGHFVDPAVALVAPRVVGSSDDGRSRWFESYEEHSSSLDLGTEPSTVVRAGRVGWLPSACLLGRVEVLGEGFDEMLRVGEDVDLVWRLDEVGWRSRYDPSVVVRHTTRTSRCDWAGRKFAYGTSSAVLTARHGDRAAPAVLSVPFAVAAALVLVRSPWAFVAVPLAWARTTFLVARRLPQIPDRHRVAGVVAARGLGWAVRQEASLLLRHWWPAALGGALVSRRVRRALVTAVVVDSVALAARRMKQGVPLPATDLVVLRFDDLAYGAGVWWGVARARSARALRVRVPGVTRGR